MLLKFEFVVNTKLNLLGILKFCLCICTVTCWDIKLCQLSCSTVSEQSGCKGRGPGSVGYTFAGQPAEQGRPPSSRLIGQ